MSRTEAELDAIVEEWAEDTIADWQHEYNAWDATAEAEELTEEELDYCQNRQIIVTLGETK